MDTDQQMFSYFRCDFDDTAQYHISAMNAQGEESAFASVVVKSRSQWISTASQITQTLIITKSFLKKETKDCKIYSLYEITRFRRSQLRNHSFLVWILKGIKPLAMILKKKRFMLINMEGFTSLSLQWERLLTSGKWILLGVNAPASSPQGHTLKSSEKLQKTQELNFRLLDSWTSEMLKFLTVKTENIAAVMGCVEGLLGRRFFTHIVWWNWTQEIGTYHLGQAR